MNAISPSSGDAAASALFPRPNPPPRVRRCVLREERQPRLRGARLAVRLPLGPEAVPPGARGGRAVPLTLPEQAGSWPLRVATRSESYGDTPPRGPRGSSAPSPLRRLQRRRRRLLRRRLLRARAARETAPPRPPRSRASPAAPPPASPCPSAPASRRAPRGRAAPAARARAPVRAETTPPLFTGGGALSACGCRCTCCRRRARLVL